MKESPNNRGGGEENEYGGLRICGSLQIFQSEERNVAVLDLKG